MLVTTGERSIGENFNSETLFFMTPAGSFDTTGQVMATRGRCFRERPYVRSTYTLWEKAK